MFNSKCGYCSPCFTLTDLVAKPQRPNQEDYTRRTGKELWKLTYSLCLTDVKCIKALNRWRSNLSINKIKTAAGTGEIYFDILPEGNICITGQDLKTLGPKVCCKINYVFGTDPKDCKNCCTLLKEAIMEPEPNTGVPAPDVVTKPLCTNGQTFFDVTIRNGDYTFSVHMALYEVMNTLLLNKWDNFINYFDLDDPVAKLYDSSDWSDCLDCPRSCC